MQKMNLKGMQELQRWASQNLKRIRILNDEVQESLTSLKTIEVFVKKVPSSAMAE
jgi:hypothetical protein